MLGSGKWRRSNSQLTRGRLITVGHFHHGGGSIRFLLEYVVTRITLDLDFPSLHRNRAATVGEIFKLIAF